MDRARTKRGILGENTIAIRKSDLTHLCGEIITIYRLCIINLRKILNIEFVHKKYINLLEKEKVEERRKKKDVNDLRVKKIRSLFGRSESKIERRG